MASVPIRYATVLAVCCEWFDVTPEAMVGHLRSMNLINARHAMLYLLRELTSMSYPEIADRVDMDHASICHACSRVRKRIKNDSDFEDTINELTNLVKEVNVTLQAVKESIVRQLANIALEDL